jgi:hypothetical protein
MNTMLAEPIEDQELDVEIEQDDQEVSTNEEFLALARNAFEESESFLDSGHKTRWRKNYSISQSDHTDGSKYLSDAFKHRSKTFRGKTESSIRKNEAALAVSMFSNRDVVTITAENQGDRGADIAAESVHKIVNYRLDTSISWFTTAIGAYHDAMIAGDVVSEQYWDYEITEDEVTLVDKPAIDLHPLEHVHVSPHSDWRDPVNSSPYFIVEIPMFIGDIKERMEADWIKYADSEIQTASQTFKHDEVDQARLGEDQVTAKQQASSVSDFDAVYVHKNFLRKDGKEWFFYSLGTVLILSEPIPLDEAYPHVKDNKRPFVWGTATVEPHKVYRRSLVDRVGPAQIQSNDIANQRFDNVKQVLNQRKYVKRGMGIDYKNLLASVPGGIVLMDDINSIKAESTPDVTGSSYQEQNMINVDFDDLAGSFSGASVATNRSLNETVGGMQLLQGDSNTMTEYQLRIFVETWVEPVIRQVVDMVQFYEDDEIIQAVTGEELTNEDINIALDVRVSVGFGSTDPQQKIQKLVYAIQSIQEITPQVMERINAEEVVREIFAALGYNDSAKFIEEQEEEQDPRIAELMEQLQELQQVIQTDQHKIQAKGQMDLQLKQAEGDIGMQIEQLKGQIDLQEEQLKIQASGQELLMKLQAERQLKLTDMALTRGMKVADIESKAGFDESKIDLEYLKEMSKRMDIDNKKRELNYKIKTGKQGI